MRGLAVPLRAIVETIGQKAGGADERCPSGDSLGALHGGLGAVLDHSWAPLRALLDDPEAILQP
eukprot:4426097-Pyramimonas_sp.AAC.1